MKVHLFMLCLCKTKCGKSQKILVYSLIDRFLLVELEEKIKVTSDNIGSVYNKSFLNTRIRAALDRMIPFSSLSLGWLKRYLLQSVFRVIYGSLSLQTLWLAPRIETYIDRWMCKTVIIIIIIIIITIIMGLKSNRTISFSELRLKGVNLTKQTISEFSPIISEAFCFSHCFCYRSVRGHIFSGSRFCFLCFLLDTCKLGMSLRHVHAYRFNFMYTYMQNNSLSSLYLELFYARVYYTLSVLKNVIVAEALGL